MLWLVWLPEGMKLKRRQINPFFKFSYDVVRILDLYAILVWNRWDSFLFHRTIQTGS